MSDAETNLVKVLTLSVVRLLIAVFVAVILGLLIVVASKGYSNFNPVDILKEKVDIYIFIVILVLFLELPYRIYLVMKARKKLKKSKSKSKSKGSE
jgi:hypothetical protein